MADEVMKDDLEVERRMLDVQYRRLGSEDGMAEPRWTSNMHVSAIETLASFTSPESSSQFSYITPATNT